MNLKVYIFRKNATDDMPFLVHHIRGHMMLIHLITSDVLDHYDKVVSEVFFTMKLLFSLCKYHILRKIIWDELCKKSVSSYIFPTNFSIHQRILTIVIITVEFKWWFSSSLMHPMLVNLNYFIRRRFPFSIYLFNHIFISLWTYRYFIYSNVISSLVASFKCFFF